MSAFTVSAAAPTVQVRASVGPARRGASVRVSQVSRDADPIHSSHLNVTCDTMKRYTGISAPYTAVHRVASAAVHARLVAVLGAVPASRFTRGRTISLT